MNRLIEVATKEGLIIEEQSPLPESFLGLYYSDSDTAPTVYLSNQIYGQPRKERSVLAEEIGHYYTAPIGNYLPAPLSSYQKTLTIARIESKALRLGGKILISKEELLDAITHGIEEIWELAEYFSVTEEFMKIRVESWIASGE